MFESELIRMRNVFPVAQARVKKAGNFWEGTIDVMQNRSPLLRRHG